MRKRKQLFGVMLILAALIIMTLPVSEADAASSASDFVMKGSTLVKYRGTEKNVSVPDTVEVIGESAFEDNTNIELVVLPNSVKRIEAYAFWGCDNLDTVVLGRGLTEVGDYAFAGCKGLKQMSIPANVTEIGAQAFGDCVNMTDITIPVETTQIHESAFDGCARLTIHCQEGSAADSIAKILYEKQKEMPEYEDVPEYDSDTETGNTEETVPAGSPEPSATSAPQATAEPPEEYGNTIGTTHVVGNRAVLFMNSGELEVKQEIGSESEAVSITKYTIVDGKIVADQAYYRNDSIQKLLLPEGIVEIGQFAFARSTLSEIGIPDGVTEIAYGAFYHCDKLMDVTLPDTICNVEPMAFSKTGWVENFLQEDSEEDFLVSGGVLIAYRGSNKEVIIPDGVRVIAAEAFQSHEEIESLKLPESVRVIGEAAFENCTGLKKVQLNQGLEEIKDRAFCGDSGVKISVPQTVKKLGLRALEGTEAVFEGACPEQSYETSATRLSNEAYRNWKEENSDAENAADKNEEEAGVTVIGLEGAYANLEGADKKYDLTIDLAEDDSVLRKAWSRAKKAEMPENMEVFELQLTDENDIPITKLGHQTLTVVIPVQDSLIGQELKAVTTDRNGQLEAVNANRVLLNGKEAIRIQTSHLSLFGVYSTGKAEDAVLEESQVSLQAQAAPDAFSGERKLSPGLIVGAVLFPAGVFLCLPGKNKKKTEQKYNS